MAAYPPQLPPDSRTDATVSAVNHAADHNTISDAVRAIVDVLGPDPAGAYADISQRLAQVDELDPNAGAVHAQTDGTSTIDNTVNLLTGGRLRSYQAVDGAGKPLNDISGDGSARIGDFKTDSSGRVGGVTPVDGNLLTFDGAAGTWKPGDNTAFNDGRYARLIRDLSAVPGNILRVAREVASFTTTGSGLTGSLVLQTGIGFNNHMTRLHVKGYSYEPGGQSIDLVITFYAYAGTGAGGYFVNYGVVNNGSVPIKVDLAKRTTDGLIAVILTPANQSATWSFPKVTVDAILSHFAPTIAETQGWTITRVTDLTPWTVVSTPVSIRQPEPLVGAWRMMSADNVFTNPTTAAFLPVAADRTALANTFVKTSTGSRLEVRVDGSMQIDSGQAQLLTIGLALTTAGNTTTTYDVAPRNTSAVAPVRTSNAATRILTGVPAGTYTVEPVIKSALAAIIRLYGGADFISYTIREIQ